MMNLELGGLIGNVEIKPDKKTGLPILNIQMMNEQGKQVKARVKKIDDRVAALKFGQNVSLRFEGLSYMMNEFGNINFGADTCLIMKAPNA